MPYQEINIDKEFLGEDKALMKEALFQYTHSRRIPSVFVGNEYIGTLQELNKMLIAGKFSRGSL